MAKTPNKPKIVQRFIEHYLKRFEKPDATNLLLSLVAKGIVDPERLRNYMIVEDYYKNLEKYNGRAKNSVLDTAETYHMCERQIQNIVYRWSDKYRAKSNIADYRELLKQAV